ncbi:WxL protein peptidoglycan domain-containing protein [Micromonospora fluostatini]|uniref:WxL protein peptidoglycan domain-containing protein n=1 Tax=Micromonospora sp. JCM 30529 TaxID=3421643 RepID=UPI003D16771B
MRALAAVAATLVLAGTPSAPAAQSPPAAPATSRLAAAPSPSPPPTRATPSADVPPGVVTIGVAPSTAKGPNGRSNFTYKLDPGATVTDHVGVVNHSTRPVTVAVYASDAFTTAQGGYDLLPADREPTHVGAWVRLPQRTVTIPSTSRLDIPFTLTVPTNATPGDHAGGIVATLAGTSSDADGNQVTVDHRVGSRIYLRVTGELAPALSVEDLDVRHTGSLNPLVGGAVTATFTVRNTGNVRLQGVPSLRVTGPFGLLPRSTETGVLPEILPGDSLRTTVRLTGASPLGRMAALTSVRPQPVGEEVLDPFPATATAQSHFWAPPWPHLILLLLLALTGWAAVTVRRRQRRRISLAIEQARAAGRAEAAGDPASATPVAAASPARSDPAAGHRTDEEEP